MFLQKEQDKTLEKELNKLEESNPPDAEFKTLLVRIMNELKGRIGEPMSTYRKRQENQNGARKHKELEENQTTLEGSKAEQIKQRTPTQKAKRKQVYKEDSLKDL